MLRSEITQNLRNPLHSLSSGNKGDLSPNWSPGSHQSLEISKEGSRAGSSSKSINRRKFLIHSSSHHLCPSRSISFGMQW